MCTINKCAHTKKKSGNLFNDPRNQSSFVFSKVLSISYNLSAGFYPRPSMREDNDYVYSCLFAVSME